MANRRKRFRHDNVKDNNSFFVNRQSLEGGPQCNFLKPNVIGFYSLDLQRKYCSDMSQLSYIVRPESYDNVNFDLNIGIDEAVKRDVNDEAKLDNLLHWISENKCTLGTDPQGRLLQDFATFRGTLRVIMNTPYENQDDWKICATKYKGTIYLCSRATEDHLRKRRDASEYYQKCLMWGYKFEQYLASGDFGNPPNLDKQFNCMEEFNVVFTSRLNNHNIIFGAEMDGFASQSEIKTLEDLQEAEFVELKTSRIIETHRQHRNTIRYKFPKWWGQCYLANIPKILCGFRTDEGIVKKIQEYNTSDLIELSKNVWSPHVCLNFLDKFLNFVRSVVEETSPDTVYVFEWKPSSDRVTVRKVEGPSDYSFVYKWYTDRV